MSQDDDNEPRDLADLTWESIETTVDDADRIMAELGKDARRTIDDLAARIIRENTRDTIGATSIRGVVDMVKSGELKASVDENGRLVLTAHPNRYAPFVTTTVRLHEEDE